MTKTPGTGEAQAADHAPENLTFRATWRWWLPVALVALLLAFLFRDPFAGDWDALDYTVLAVRGVPSSMLFGRMLFIFTNHYAYQLAHALFGLQPEHAYLLFKYMVVCESPIAIMGMWAFARQLTNSVRAATVAALLLALSPFFIIYAGQAMTEIPSLVLLTWGLALNLRGMQERRASFILLSAVLLGLSVNVRESVAIYGLWLALAPLVFRWKIDARTLILTGAACMLFFVCALGPFATFYLFDISNYRASWYGWLASMHMEEAVHPVTPVNFLMLAFFFFVSAPLVLITLPSAARREWRAHKFSPLLVLALIGLLANLLLITHYSAIINGRYQLTGLPGALPLVAAYLLHRQSARTADYDRAFRRVLIHVSLVAVLIGAGFMLFAWPTLRSHAITAEYHARLALLPTDAVVMAGGHTVSVTYYRDLGLGRWDTIGTGGGWPGPQLPEVIDNYLRAGRRVFLDTDERLWFTDNWRGAETQQLVAIADRYRFRRVTDTIYEIRPREDETAHDEPNLRRLLDKPASRFLSLFKR
ncbi:MAG: glycosyltransferase family 39 protein [Pyrinomonadaceae bacterium]